MGSDVAGTPADNRVRLPVVWSETRKEALSDIAVGRSPSRNPIQPLLSAALLKCVDGDFDGAEYDILELLDKHRSLGRLSEQAYVGLLQALFTIQRFDLVCELLRERHSFPGRMSIDVEDAGRAPACLQWIMLSSGEQRFSFDASIYRDDRTTHKILHLHWILPLFAHYGMQAERDTGSVIINQFDLGIVPGFAFSDSRPDYFLLPDQIFVPTKGYGYARKVFRENEIAWGQRRATAFWRGSTTGPKPSPNDWRSLARVKLCQLAQRNRDTGLIDAQLSSVIQFSSPDIEQEIRQAGLLGDFVPWQAWGQYRYHIDIDGNSSPFSNLFQRLLTGGTVLKVESARGLRQWYYDDLVPWSNYIPIAPDFSDLLEKIRWLERHDDFARKVGQAGLALAERLTYDRELQRSVPTISAALRYFRGDYGIITPFGRSECK